MRPRDPSALGHTEADVDGYVFGFVHAAARIDTSLRALHTVQGRVIPLHEAPVAASPSVVVTGKVLPLANVKGSVRSLFEDYTLS